MNLDKKNYKAVVSITHEFATNAYALIFVFSGGAF